MRCVGHGYSMDTGGILPRLNNTSESKPTVFTRSPVFGRFLDGTWTALDKPRDEIVCCGEDGGQSSRYLRRART